MKNHPLFTGQPGDSEEEDERKAKLDLGFIQIFRFTGSRRIGYPKMWPSEELQTIEDVYEALEAIRKGNGTGSFELCARDRTTKAIQAKVRIDIEGQIPQEDEPERPAQLPQAQPAAQQAQPSGPPSMTGAGLQIPTGTDPATAMLLMFSNMQMESSRQAREDSRAHAAQLQQMFMAFSKNQADLVVGLVNGRQAAPAESSGELLMKGVEMGVELMKGAKEVQQSEDAGTPLDMNSIAANIAQSINGIRDIAVATGRGTGPVIPPGTP